MKTSSLASTADALSWHWDSDPVTKPLSKDPVRMRWHQHHLERAQRDDSAAQFMVGIHFEKGYGVGRDYAEAYKWYAIAKSNGYAPAAIAKNRMANLLTVDERAEAEHVVRMWNLGALVDGLAPQ
jgi:TPR repeat protein